MSDERRPDDPDPAILNNLQLMPRDEVADWLRIERSVLANHTPGVDRSDQRARWASARVKRLEAELDRRRG